jgi:hypothetical protein
MATTEDQLIGFVLDNYGSPGGLGQSVSSEDLEKVRPYVALVLADLAESQIIYIADGDSVPDAAVMWVAALIAHAPGLRRFYGEPEGIQSAEYCRARLRSLRGYGDYSVLEATYY